MIQSPDLLPMAVRAYTPPTTIRRTRTTQPWQMPDMVLVFDTETTTDTSQRLLFGVWRVYHKGTLIDEGLFLAEDLPAAAEATIRAYVADRPGLRILTRRAFLNEVFWKVAYKARGLVVGFNLPFDISRLAVGVGTARGPVVGGGFSFVLWEYEQDGVWRENRYRPRITVKSIDSKRSLIQFTKRRNPDQDDLIPEGGTNGTPDPAYIFRGHFLDLRALAFAHTNASHSLASACETFGVEHGKFTIAQHGVISSEYLDYARRDVLATYELMTKLLEEHQHHPIALAPTKALSPASIGKAYLRAMGVVPPLERWPDFPPEVLGYAMTAYYGGRAETHIRRTPVPVVYLDFLSMYPTVNTLMGLWDYLTAERIEIEDATQAVRDLLATVTLDVCFDPAFWRQLPVLVQIQPDHDIVPVRARYDGSASWQIGLNVLHSGEPRWYTLADCIASTLLTGKPPTVLQALRLLPKGRQAGLRPVRLRGEISIDPEKDDLFQQVIELRKNLPGDLAAHDRVRLGQFLKVLANSTSYGIFAEMNRQELGAGKKQRVTVYGLDPEPFEANVTGPEEPGALCFPPLAAFIAGAARLMLALLERCVTDLGGTYAMCDTDSMAIVATEHGGLVPCPAGPDRYRRKPAIRALSWEQVESIRQRFAQLNPYDRPRIAGSVLQLEDVNFDTEGNQHQIWCYAISAKRYCLYMLNQDGEPQLLKWSEHGLGHLLNPTDPESDDRAWMRQVWEGIIRTELELPYQWPKWVDRPALSRLTISSPALLKPFADLNAGKTYKDQVKPFNFMLTAHVPPLGHPDGVDPARFQLIAPYESNPKKWPSLPWTDRYSGQRFSTTATDSLHALDSARIQTYCHVLDAFRSHPESKSAGANGRMCGRSTIGFLHRRAITETFIIHIGKESNKLEDVEIGLERDPDIVFTIYADPKRDEWTAVILPQLRQQNLAALARTCGVSERQLRMLAHGRSRPRMVTSRRIASILVTGGIL
jgi:DNA polymerase III epsilon subunit-like protein